MLNPQPIRAQETEPEVKRNWRIERINLEHQFGEELTEIADWCRQQGIPQQVEPTFQLKINRDPQRQYIFPPTTKKMPEPQEGVLGQWLEKVNAARRSHASRIFELAREAALADAGGIAYQLLHEVIFYDRDHEETRAMLRHIERDDYWRVASATVKVRESKRDHDLFEIPAGGYITVTTPHFQIESTVGEERTRFLADQLERWHGVWRQVFFEYWASASYPKKLFDGKAIRLPTTRFRVLFLKNQQEYLYHLSQRVRGVVAESTGYYSNTEQISIFYDGGELEQDTWQHELTHQMFRESERTRKAAFEDGYFWVDEGIACYFESLRDFDTHVTIGGFDARRVQFARLRRFLEDYYVPLEEFSAIGLSGFQKRADMRLMYSQSAGLAEMLMNDGNGELEQQFIGFLTLVYKRKPKPDAFEKLLGSSVADLDKRYVEFLKVDSERVARYLASPETQTVLSLSKADLDTAAFDSIGRCVNLLWLDISGNQVTQQRLTALAECDQLSQLFMTECAVGEDALSGLGGMKNLTELDLSGSSVTDSHLAGLAKCPALVSVKLIATRISDQGLLQLAKIPNLQEVYLSRASFSTTALAKLKSTRPRLSIIQY
ncbi:MAG: hypothetical protein AAFN77_09680 [Planctomycetota bacterium]